MPDLSAADAALRPLLAEAAVVAQACADAVRPIAARYFRGHVGADSKSDESPVTIADREAEQAMRAIIAQAYPDHGILGEEFGATAESAAFQWVLDPIDGTRAFLTGRPTFGTLIALLHEGRPVLGLLDQPILRERWIGVAGAPTQFISTLGGAIGTRARDDVGEAELSCTSPEMLAGPPRARFERLAGQVRRTYWGGDCYAYGLLALGQIDIVAECAMKIWDWAALVPIVEGAGGSMTDWQGARLRADGDGSVLALGDARHLATVVASLAEV